jgi:hypothetical protein
MTDKPTPASILRQVEYYAGACLALYPYDLSSCTLPDRAEKAALHRGFVDRRHAGIEAALKELVAGDPGLITRIADAAQREIDANLTAGGQLADPGHIGERVAHALCADIPEIGQAVR